jgi:hypothetical protein
VPEHAKRCVEVLQGGHAFSILVARVEKPTDNSSVQSFCHRTWLMLILQEISLALAPAHFPHPSVRLGPRLLRRTHRFPLLRAGPDAETRPQSPN